MHRALFNVKHHGNRQAGYAGRLGTARRPSESGISRAGGGGRRRGFFVSFGARPRRRTRMRRLPQTHRPNHQASDRAGDSGRGTRADDVFHWVCLGTPNGLFRRRQQGDLRQAPRKSGARERVNNPIPPVPSGYERRCLWGVRVVGDHERRRMVKWLRSATLSLPRTMNLPRPWYHHARRW